MHILKISRRKFRQTFNVYSYFHQVAEWRPQDNTWPRARLIWVWVLERLDSSFTQEMFRNTWLGYSERCFPSGPICYEFLIVIFRHTFLGMAWNKRLSSENHRRTCSWCHICKSKHEFQLLCPLIFFSPLTNNWQ